MEQWKAIKGFEGIYEVSDAGRVRTLERRVWSRSNKSYSLLKGKLMKLDTRNKTYAQIGLWKEGKTYKRLVHRLVAEAFIPNPEGLPEIDHKNNIPLDNSADNLRWCTHFDNMQHRKQTTGYVIPRGSKHPSAKLCPEAVRHIRTKEMMGKEYAKLYNVSVSLISQVQNRKDFWEEVS